MLATALEKYSEKIRVEGIEQGIEQGELKKARESAQKRLEEGIEIKLISRITGLTVDEIKKVQRGLDH